MTFYSKWVSVKSAEDHSGHKYESVWKSMYIYWTETSNFIVYLLLWRNFIKVLNAKISFSFALEKKQYLKAIAIYILSLERKLVEMLLIEMLIGRKKYLSFSMKKKYFLIILSVCMKYYISLQEVFFKFYFKLNKSLFDSLSNQYGFQR